MPALNFKAEFEPPILNGTKVLTMRAPRVDGRDPAPVGSALGLFTGMRTKSCRRILQTESVYRCGLQFGDWGPVAVESETGDSAVHRVLINAAMNRQRGALDVLARADGFPDWMALWAFHSASGVDDIGCVYREVIGWALPGGRS